jgi:restriction endonuclease S subunit
LRLSRRHSKTKIQKEAEAKKLLNNIYDYLLSELGIELPEQEGNLESRIFSTSFNEIASRRYDPLFYHYDKIKFEKKYPIKKLKELVEIQKGQSITSKEIEEGPYPVIAGSQTSPYNHNNSNYNGNVITISASGAYSGYVWYHKSPIFASDCNILFSKNEKICNTAFLYWVLKAIQTEIYKLQQGAGQPHVYPHDLKNILIPLPKLDKQKKVLQKANARKLNAQELKKQAQQEIKNARQEIEAMILSD